MPNFAAAIMRRRHFRPGPWPTAAAALAFVATIMLGNWQERRAEIRGAMQLQSVKMAEQAPMRLVGAADITLPLRYRRVVAEGEYLPERQVWLDNRTYKGVAGFYVLTPLRFDDGTHLLVNRGWIEGTAQRTAPAAMPPAGRVSVEGRLNQSPPSFIELQHVAPAGPIWQNLDMQEFARVTGLAPAPLVLEQAKGSQDGLIRDWPAPDSGRDKNVSYMLQWYSFAALSAMLWLVLSWRRSEEHKD